MPWPGMRLWWRRLKVVVRQRCEAPACFQNAFPWPSPSPSRCPSTPRPRSTQRRCRAGTGCRTTHRDRPVVALLCPALLFLAAIAVEIVIGVLVDAGIPLLPAFAAGVVGWLLLRTLRRRPGGVPLEA